VGLASYLIRRAIYSVILVFGAVFLTFILTHIIAPDPAAAWAGPHASQIELQGIEREYHLNQPVYVQLLYYVEDAFTFNFGISPAFKQPVSTLILTYYPRTLVLDFLAIALTIVLGVFSGAFSAANQDRPKDHLVRAIYMVSWGAPPFLVALILQFVFSYHWGIFPSTQMADPSLGVPRTVTGIISLDALITGDYTFFFSWVEHAILPVIALALISFGIVTRIMRSSMLTTLRTDYIRTARMKGIGDTRAIYRHALKNSLIPVITIISLVFAYLIAGSIIIEQIFGYEGMGYLITQSVYLFDYPTLIGCTIVVTISVVIINFVADVAYALVDPRIRLGQ